MATVVDSLVVTLGLDASDFKREAGTINVYLKDTREGAKKTADELESQGKRASSYFADMKSQALGLLGVFLGGRGLTQFIKETTASMADLGREARGIGIAVGDLDAFRKAVERNGGSAAAAAQSLRHLTDEVANFKIGRGSADFIGAMGTIGGQLTDSPLQAFEKFARFAEAHRDNVPLVNKVGQMLGLDQGSINEALRGAEQFRKDMQESLDIGVTTKEMSEDAQRLQASWRGFEQAAGHAADVVADKLSPALSDALDYLKGLMKANPGATQLIVEGTGALVSLVTVITGAQMALGLLRLSGLAVGFRALGTAITFATGGAMVGALAKLAAGITALAATIDLAGIMDIIERGPTGNIPADEREQLNRALGLPPGTRAGTPVPEGTPAGPTGGDGSPAGSSGGLFSTVNPIGTAEAAARPVSVPPPTGGDYYSTIRAKIYAAAIAAGVAHPDVVADVGAAQSSLETGFGKHVVGNNYFGIKSGGGVGSGSVSAGTSEYVNGVKVSQNASFAAFGGMDDSAAGYVAFLKRNPRYAALLASGDREGALRELQRSGYATDPAYGAKVGSIMSAHAAAPDPRATAPAPGPATRLPSVPPAAAVRADADKPAVTVHVSGDTHIHTQATDAGGIAADYSDRMADEMTMAMANRGLQ